jgi:hypothetical protein
VVDTWRVSEATEEPSGATVAAPEAFRHLPDVIAIEDTITSIRGDFPPGPSGEQNAFIAAAVDAGG